MGKKTFNKLRRVEKKRVEREKIKRKKNIRSHMCGLLINNEV
jgi:hypothetical protein